MTTYRLLHVEDSPDDAELMRLTLRSALFDVSITRVETEPAYVAELDARPPDVVICDYNLPQFSAEQALRIARERRLDVPFLIVSNHIGETAAVVAMQNGASDYLPKQDLGRLAKAIESAIDRCNARREKAAADEALRGSESLKRGILDSLASHIAVLDGNGVIVAVNRQWTDSDNVRAQLGLGDAATGANYLQILQEAADRGSTFAQARIESLRAVIARERRVASIEYPVSSGTATRWFLARAMPMEGSEHGVVISHTDITDQVIAHAALQSAHKGLQSLSKRLLTIQEEERRAISRELHDDIGQSLSALTIGLHRLAQEGGGDPPGVLAECLKIAEATLDRLRELALELRPPQLDQLGLEDALDWLAQRQRNATGLAVTCRFSGMENRRPSTALETACYRIAQEALNNATRHASAKAISINLESDGRLLKLSIHDDGIGFDAEATRERALKSGNLGLISMEERARLAGGRLKLRSVAGGGTTLGAIFPLDDPDSERSGAELAVAAA